MLLRSRRWLPPLLLYAAALLVGVRGGEPVLDSLGYAAAVLLPVAAWLARACVTGEPPAARWCAAAAAGPGAVQLASLLGALLVSAALGAAGAVAVAVIGGPHGGDRATAVPPVPAAGAGLLAVLTCALLGTAVGALCNRPLLRGTGRAVPATVLASVAALVVPWSPANAAVGALVTGSRTADVSVPLLPCAAALLVAAGAVAVSCRAAARRG
ncbi:ABC transporter [Streptomyces carminius]|uniref:ABC transporter n=1 Tax=Streptomyces carminius TaxID=2665496 RepID=A0A2M8LPQ9_9ACTN|nr:ABC transporter [Streptomyces carminius]PJE93939.1 ABC transporter [Streptomyces carminius]